MYILLIFIFQVKFENTYILFINKNFRYLYSIQNINYFEKTSFINININNKFDLTCFIL